MLKNKTVVLGVTGSIAAYKMANVASMLVKLHADVHVIMTKNATNFINPITFETLTGNKCLVDTFDRNFQFNVEHVALAKRADIFMVAPASANIIGKIACGIADDMLSTTIMAAKCPKTDCACDEYKYAGESDCLRQYKETAVLWLCNYRICKWIPCLWRHRQGKTAGRKNFWLLIS